MAEQGFPGVLWVVGDDLDGSDKPAGELAAIERDDEFFGGAGLDGTVGPTVEFCPSPALGFDLKVGGALVADLERERE